MLVLVTLPRCHHPSNVNPVEGGIAPKLCSYMRSTEGPCGPEGRMFFGIGEKRGIVW